MGRPLKRNGGETREAVLDAALDVFAEKGFHGASLKDIAAIVGVRDSAIYHYFESKEALVDAILAERSNRAPDDVRKRWLEGPLGDARTEFVRIGDAIVERMELPQTEKIFRILMGDGLRLHAEKRVNLLRFFDGAHIPQLMDRLIRDKKLRKGRPDLLAIEFIAPFHVLMMLRLLQPGHPIAEDRRGFVRAHVEHFLSGASRKSA